MVSKVDNIMDLTTGLTLALIMLVVGATGLVVFAIWLANKYGTDDED